MWPGGPVNDKGVTEVNIPGLSGGASAGGDLAELVGDPLLDGGQRILGLTGAVRQFVCRRIESTQRVQHVRLVRVRLSR